MQAQASGAIANADLDARDLSCGWQLPPSRLVRVRACVRALYLPVGGGARVEDVLLGREQRQAVGIKVNGLLAHDATPANM